ncbi:MAG: hypothetical protein ACN6RD_11955 [Stenotrophomonas maltophilia]
MELLGFFVVFLLCMGLAKAVNAIRGRLTVNGAAIHLLLTLIFAVYIVVTAVRADLPPGAFGYALGYALTPALLVGALAAFFVFRFRADKADQARVQRLREQRLRAGADRAAQ